MTLRKVRYQWTPGIETSFKLLKVAMTSPRILAFPNFERLFIVETNVSTLAVGAVLPEKGDDGKSHLIQFTSRPMTTKGQKYSSCNREVLAVVFALRNIRLYLLLPEPFIVTTDHQTLPAAFL